ncbi:hypothetical protein Mgra_00002299 [Meloidogyne graminicola]|uniref:Uncharacterized protein n=1 Tax=Meloidogyne graminicola TaxID=189291 RepID=A0A8S9ZX63_9BILA|nr:hypothetical protein Mgra_00002299 [Meloidogyne graminicola]
MYDYNEGKEVEVLNEEIIETCEDEQHQQDEEVQNIQEENSPLSNSSISLFHIIIIALTLFLALNGPTNYSLLWNQLINPPLDARHAIRIGSGYGAMIPFNSHKIIPIQTIQLREYALGIKTNAENRITLINRMFGDLALDSKKMSEMAELLVGINMKNVKEYFTKLQNFSFENFQNKIGGKEIHEKIMERWIKFMDNISHIQKNFKKINFNLIKYFENIYTMNFK